MYTTCLLVITAFLPLIAALGAPVHESGILTKNQTDSEQWHSVSFSEIYTTSPIVVLGPLTTAGPNPSTVRVRNVTTAGFEWQIDEYQYLDGSHTTESVGYVAMEPGVHGIGGLTWEAARANVGGGYANISLAGSFTGAPVVLSQIETANNIVSGDDTECLMTRTRTVTTTGFQIRIQDEEGQAGNPVIESVGYIAVSEGSTYFDGKPLVVVNTPNSVTGNDYVVDFGAELRNAVILGNQQTTDGGDPCRVRIRSTTDTSATIFLEEEASANEEIGHTTESVGFFVLGDGYDEIDAKLDLITTTANGNWQTLTLAESYDDPIVVIGPPSYNGGDVSTVRVRNVTPTSIDYQIDEWDYRDGGHTTEEISVIVMERGVFKIGGLTWQADSVDGVTQAATAGTFVDEFDTTPMVVAQVTTVNEESAVAHRLNTISETGFTVELDEEKANDGVHSGETVHYIAIEPGQAHLASSAILFGIAVTPRTIADDPELIPFETNFASPIFIADMQSNFGGDPSTLRVTQLNSAGATVFVEEEDSTGDGLGHTTEVVGYLVAASAIDLDEDGISDEWENLNGLDPTDPSDAALDPDGDLLTNVEEYDLNYDPTTFNGGTVTVQVIDSDAYELNDDKARIRFRRANGKAALTLRFAKDGGTDASVAASPSDYRITTIGGTSLGTTITLPANVNSIDVYVDPETDSIYEYPETVRVRALPGTATPYVVGGANSALTTLSDATDDPANDKLYVGLYEAEAPAQGQTTASGFATLLVNGSNTQARVSSSFSGLTTTQTVSHIHHANESNPGTGAGPIVIGMPVGQIESETWNIVPSPPYSGQDLIDSLNKANGFFLYINVHTSQFTGGEIRAIFDLADGGPFDPPANPPAITTLSGDDLTRDVSRFLTQATFGPTTAEINALVADINNNHGGDQVAGFSQWIDDQFNLDQTNLYDLTYAADTEEFDLRNADPLNPSGGNHPQHNNRRREWWTMAVKGHDQLRQRTGFALSEIFIISELEAEVRVRHYGAAKYYDMLLGHADGNFRDLLVDVSKSPMMGKYLSHLKNQKTQLDPTTGEVLFSPDENYAREIMQLFSIGLLEQNPDGTLKLNSANGLPVQTYTNEDITAVARVFTGWSFSKRHGAKADGYPILDNTNFNFGSGPRYFQASWENPMINFGPTYHDTDEKNFLGGTVDANQSGEQDLQDTVDILYHHPNVGPFLARLMIQRFTTSNPSRGYIYRVAQAFETGTHDGSGSGQRGDFGAMVKAILLDYEARTLSVADDIGYGKQKEPILRYLQLIRGLEGKSLLPLSSISSYGYPANQLNNFPANTTRYRYPETTAVLGQSPLRNPSVFNWFLPDYDPGGDISTAGLVAPEMQITTETQVVFAINYQRNLVWNTNGQSVNALVGQSDGNDDNVRIDFAPLQAIYNAEISAGGSVTDAATKLVDHLDVLLMSGNFKAAYGGASGTTPRSIVIDTITNVNNGVRVRTALYLMANSPEYMHQK